MENEASYGNKASVLQRYVWLIDTIQSNSNALTRYDILKKWAASSLNDYPGQQMAEKTFHNHVNAIKKFFGLKIKCHKYGSCTYYIENSEDMAADNALSRWMLSTITIKNSISDSVDMQDRIIFEDIPSGQEYLTTVISAMKHSHPLQMLYGSYWRPEDKEYIVEPYFVKVFKQRWYLIGYDIGKKAIRIFSLDRIKSLELLTERTFKYPQKFNPKDYFTGCFGIIHDDDCKTETIRIKVSGNQERYVRSLPLHESQREFPADDGFSVFEYRLKPTFDFLQEIFSHMDDFEVLSPQSLRDEIKARTEQMLKIYK